MAYGIRKMEKDGIHRGFQWNLEIGSTSTAPDWRPDSECGGGLHFCAKGDDNGYLDGDLFAVIEYDETEAIDLGGKHKVESCKLIYLGEDRSGIWDFIDRDDWFSGDSRGAYHWARHIGDREHMRQFVTEPQWAYLWALNIGDREHMRQFVTDPEWAYLWARHIGDREHMRQSITDPKYAYFWARHIGDEEHMRAICKGTPYEF